MNEDADTTVLDNKEFGEDIILDSVEQIEMDLVLEAVMRRYGYDFRQYSENVLKRRLNLFRVHCKAQHLSETLPHLLRDRELMHQLLLTMSVPVTEFFRDPEFFTAFRKQVMPILHTYAFISLWCAGCASGEEAYSWAILLDEEGLLERSRIYATDINSHVLQEGRSGVYSQDHYTKACENYLGMGGKRSFDDYCQRSYGAFKMAGRLQKHITFARHNLVHDGVFGEMVVVSCRNVMIYFNSELKKHSLELFSRSLCHQGFLCLGDTEAIDPDHINLFFQLSDRRHRIYQKMHAGIK